MRRLARFAAFLAVAAASALTIVLVNAPAAWLGFACAQFSEGQVLLAETQGTIWRGRGVVVFAGTGNRTRLPGRIAWDLAASALLRARVELTIQADIMPAQFVTVGIDRHGALRLGAGSLSFPAQVLTGLGAPWNTIKPRGRVTLAWNAWDANDPAHAPGGGRLVWTEAASALCAVDPLGSYRLGAASWMPGAALRLETLSGPMTLVGDGTIGGPSLVRFRLKARVRDGTDERIANQVASVVALIGPRDGDGAALQIGP